MKKIIISLFTLVFVFSIATPARAQTPTIADLLALLQQLQAQLQVLLANQNDLSQPKNDNSICSTFLSDLTVGSTGYEVTQLQALLEKKGYLMMPSGVAKGYFGPATQQALARYQSAIGVSNANGLLNSTTRSKINAQCVDELGKGETPMSTGLSFSDKAFEFKATEGKTLVNNYEELRITNKSDTNVTLKVRVPRQPSWLDASYTTNEITIYPDQVVGFGVMVDPNGLDAGTYKTELIFEGNFLKSPQKVPVILKVSQTETEQAISLKVKHEVVVDNNSYKQLKVLLSGGTTINPVSMWTVNLECSAGISTLNTKGGIDCGEDYTFGSTNNTKGDAVMNLDVYLNGAYKDTERLDYTVKALDKNNNEIGYKTGVIQVNNVQETPFIKVVSPNGEEKFSAGSNVKIDVKTNLTDKQTDGITLQLYRSYNSSNFMYVGDIERNWTRGFPYTWNVPIVDSGQYLVYAAGDIIGGYKDGGVSDFSDKPFTIENQQDDVSISRSIISTGESFEGDKRWDGIKLSLNSSDNSRVKMWNIIMSCPANVGSLSVKAGGDCGENYYISNESNGTVFPVFFERLDYNTAIINFKVEAYDSTDIYRANEIGEINFSHDLAKG